jgi:hypothetical protein
MTILLGAAIGSAIAIAVLLGYLNVHRITFGFHWSPRLTACWLLPIVDAVVTLWLIGAGWFGLGGPTGIQMSLFSVWTAIGLSITVFTIRGIFIKRWRKQFQEAKQINNRHYQRKVFT